MSETGEQLRAKLVDMLRRRAAHKREIALLRESAKEARREKCLGLIDILDILERVDRGCGDEESGGAIGSLRRRIGDMLAREGVVPVVFDDGKARMETCRVVDAIADTSRENQVIVDIIKKGYFDKRDDCVLRKADVITVLNG